MRNLVAFMPLAVAACAAMPADEPPPVVHGQTPGYECRSEGLSSFVGREATSEVGREILARSGAKVLRWLTPGMIVTMEFRSDRVNVHVGSDNRIQRVNCG